MGNASRWALCFTMGNAVHDGQCFTIEQCFTMGNVFTMGNASK
jgi:hypothetical protein